MIKNIPRKLTASNINEAINLYLNLLKTSPINIEAKNVLGFLNKLKREKVQNGPYPNVSLFEAANRIMTDLTILFGIKSLFEKRIKEINFDSYTVEFGNENFNAHDITAEKGSSKLIGEAFNVAESFFQTKKSSALKKLRKSKLNNEIILIIYNSDAIKEKYLPKPIENEFHLPVKLDF